MTTLEWNETDSGYRSGPYQISPVGSGQWSLEADPSLKPPVRQGSSDDAGIFKSLKSARAAALHLEIVRVRRAKLIRHVTLSIVAFGLSVAFYLTMSASSETNRLEWFVLAGAALFIALSEGLDAFVLLVEDGWDYRYEVPKLSMLDRSVSSVVISAVWRQPVPIKTSEQSVLVRPLT
jgi:hypothetical protein